MDKNLNVIAGHGRIEAAKAAGLDAVPCVFIEGLTDAQRRRYIIEDNRLSEFGEWDMDVLEAELRELFAEGVEVGEMDFDLDIGPIEEEEITFEDPEAEEEEKPKGKKWTTRGVRCDMKPCLAARTKDGRRYVSLYASSKEGMTLEEIKNSRKCEKQIAEALEGHIRESLGSHLGENGWAMITTGRRRHRDGYHFATAVCKGAAQGLGIAFYEGAIECGNADRLKPELALVKEPAEKNLILFDDIITTGTTMSKTADLLLSKGYTVLIIIGIRNQ